ncbi:hypothetical protein [Thiolinea disciformis]|nr:hypothetical protein [Thiolinea disciformis]
MQAIFERLQRLPSGAYFVLTGFVGMVLSILLITGWYQEDKLISRNH